MRVLIVSFAFPPSNVIGAVRVGKFARYLYGRGHDLRVLTTDIIKDRSLPLEIPRDRIVHTEYPERDNWLEVLVARLRRSGTSIGDGSEASQVGDGVPRNSVWHILRQHYHALTHIPDQQVDWIKTALPPGRRLLLEWKPDIIFASAPPFTALIVAGRLSRAFKIPWVADFRDLWTDNHYYGFPAWRRPIDAVLERLTLRNAARVVTVSPIWAEQLSRYHGKPAEVVYNGYSEEDMPEPPVEVAQGRVLTIRYTGSIYRGHQDPSPLFAAIAMLENGLRRQVRVEFFGEAEVDLKLLAARHGVVDRITVCPTIPYSRALELQMQADVLLLLHSVERDARQAGMIPAKLFEYLYARHPILFIGYERGIAAQLVRERGAGLVSNAPAQISDQLHAWITDKKEGRFKRLGPSVCRGFSRDEQYRKVEQLFGDILRERSRTIGNPATAGAP